MEYEIFYVGVFVTILLAFGFLYTVHEFRKMGKNPEDYRDEETFKNRK